MGKNRRAKTDGQKQAYNTGWVRSTERPTPSSVATLRCPVRRTMPDAGVRGGVNCMNPLEDISHTRKIHAVVLGGKFYAVASLRAQSLQDAAKQ
jgi:hypothetical protein